MSITRLETKIKLLKNLDLFANLLESFPDSKKQIKYIRKMLHQYSREANEKNFLINENEKDDIHYFITEIQKIAFRLQKAKTPDAFKRLHQALQLYHTELTKAISKAELKLAEIKGKAVLENIVEKAKSFGDTITHGIEKIKKNISNSTEESTDP